MAATKRKNARKQTEHRPPEKKWGAVLPGGTGVAVLAQ